MQAAFTGVIRSGVLVARPTIFISYSHADEVWKERLVTHLGVLEGRLDVWDDRRMGAGREWRAEIQSAIDRARVAILLLSADFLASPYLLDTEVHSLLRRRHEEQLMIVPVVVRPCAWASVPWLARLQVAPRDGRSLASMPAHACERALVEIVRLVLRHVRQAEAATFDVPLHVAEIRLTGVRAFRELTLNIVGQESFPRRRTLLIGRNGTCKTTALRAVALGLCDESDANALLAEALGGMCAEDVDVASLEIDLQPTSGETQRLTRRKEIVRKDGKDTARDLATPPPPREPLVCAYGAGRFGVGPEIGRGYRIRDSVASLFDYRQTLTDAELTLRRLSDHMGTARFERTLAGIKRVLGLAADDEIRPGTGGGVEVSGPSIGRKIRLEAWADGYRMTFAWLLDLYGWAMRADRLTPAGGIEGIVLIDEIEQHLHPAMQTTILQRLAEILPDAQIFATTHSPLVALGVRPDELVVLRRLGDAVVADAALPDFTGYSAEDMLVDEHLFDTPPYGPEISQKLSRYRELVQRRPDARDPSETDELRRLAAELAAQQLPEVRQSQADLELGKLVRRLGL